MCLALQSQRLILLLLRRMVRWLWHWLCMGASERADVVEAVTAVHGAVALFGQVLQDLAGVDGRPTDADVTDVTIIVSTIILQNLTKHEQHHREQQQKPQLHDISTLIRSPIHNRIHGHLTIRHQPQQRHQHPA